MSEGPVRRHGLSPAEFEALSLASQQKVHAERLAGEASFGLDVDGRDVVTDKVRRASSRLPSRSLVEVLNGRRSTTNLAEFSLEYLVAVLARSYRIQHASHIGAEDSWTLRPVPSAGATHPFDLLVSSEKVNGLTSGRYLFNAHSVGLEPLASSWDPYAEVVEAAAMRASRRTTPAPATVTLIADVGRVSRRYQAPLTLLLRDAGVLLQTLHLVATDLGLASTIVGSAGHVPDRGGTDSESLVVDCGALLVGATGERVEENPAQFCALQ